MTRKRSPSEYTNNKLGHFTTDLAAVPFLGSFPRQQPLVAEDRAPGSQSNHARRSEASKDARVVGDAEHGAAAQPGAQVGYHLLKGFGAARRLDPNSSDGSDEKPRCVCTG